MQPILIAVNASEKELETLGGDSTIYRDCLAMNMSPYEMVTARDSSLRRISRFVRKAIEKSSAPWQPRIIRRYLLLLSRSLFFVPQVPARAVFSHVLLPWPTRKYTVVWSSQGISPEEYYERAKAGSWDIHDVAWLYGRKARSVAAFVVSTRDCADRLIDFHPHLREKVHVIHPPVEEPPQFERTPRADGVVFVFVGLDPVRKGLPEVVEAFRDVIREEPATKLKVLSRVTGDLADTIRKTDRMELIESSPSVNVGSLLEEADVLVLPSRADTYGLVMVEAMARACAVITSDLNPLAEVAPPEIGGTVRVGSSTEIKERALRLIRDPALLLSMQTKARDIYLARNHPDVVASQLKRVFEMAAP